MIYLVPGLLIALFHIHPAAAIEGKEFIPNFQNPPTANFEISPPQNYLQTRTNELFRFLEEPPVLAENTPDWYSATKISYGGIGHNNWQGFLSGHRKNNAGMIRLNMENEYDFGLKEDRQIFIGSNHYLSSNFYLQINGSALWSRRPRPEDDEPYPRVSTAGGHQSLSIYTREFSQNRLTHTWLGGNHTLYENRETADDWHNWQIGFSRVYQFFLNKTQPSTLGLAFSGDRLSADGDAQLRTWSELIFNLTRPGPYQSRLFLGGKLLGFSRYHGSFKVGFCPELQMGKRFTNKLLGRLTIQSVYRQPTVKELLFDESIGEFVIDNDNIVDGEIYDPFVMRATVNFQLSAEEHISFFFETRYRQRLYFWEDQDENRQPELYFTDNGLFIWLSGLIIDTNLSSGLNQQIQFEVENQHHGNHIYPNISELYLRGQLQLTYRYQSSLKLRFDYVGDTFQDRRQIAEVNGSFRLDLGFRQYLSKNFTFLLEGLNITDTNYYNAYGFNEKNRRYRLGVLIQK